MSDSWCTKFQEKTCAYLYICIALCGHLLTVTWEEVVTLADWGLVFPFRELGSCRDVPGLPHLHSGMHVWLETFSQRPFQPLHPRGPLPWHCIMCDYLIFFFFFLCLLTKLSENGHTAMSLAPRSRAWPVKALKCWLRGEAPFVVSTEPSKLLEWWVLCWDCYHITF